MGGQQAPKFGNYVRPTRWAVWRAENEPSLDVWEPSETL
jgi:hypothetical protein